MIDEKQLTSYFLELVAIDSVSRKERDIALKLKGDLEALGATVTIDDAGDKVHGNVGNLIARVPGTVPGLSPLLLSAHMDTVVPGEGVKAIVEGSVVHTDGTTILGADDKSGLAIIIQVLRTLKEQSIPYGDIEVVFTICEEKGLLGAKNLDTSVLKARYGLVLDCDEVGSLFIKGPAANHMEWRIFGLESHAGVAPERGINAIRIASEGIAAMTLGRIDPETTANVGVITGGAATNIVPNQVAVHGEARSHDVAKLEAQTQHMTRCLEEAAARYSVTVDGQTYTGLVETTVNRAYDPMNVSEDSAIAKLVQRAGENLGVPITLGATGGGCDANIFNGVGMLVANLGTGMRGIHTVKESIDLRDLHRAANLVLEVVRLSGDGLLD